MDRSQTASVDHFIADAVRKTVLFNTGERRESAFTEAGWNNFCDYGEDVEALSKAYL